MNETRKATISDLSNSWDIIVVGGGITGTGILKIASQCGYKTLLLEANDFSFGTSSRSSKLIHGGFRYLRNKQFGVSRESVHERQYLLKTAPNLINDLPFLLPGYKDEKPSIQQLGIGVVIYDLFAKHWKHRRFSPDQIRQINPILRQAGLLGAYQYYDALMDDSAVVLRLVSECSRLGGTALNYMTVKQLLRDNNGCCRGVLVKDSSSEDGLYKELHSRVVINATGPWCDTLRSSLGLHGIVRKSRGSHLIFPSSKIPLNQAVTLYHPSDNRVMFAIPWQGKVIIGTTDIDHTDNLAEEPFATQTEIDYLLTAIKHNFPTLGISQSDILSTFSGLRPLVCQASKENPSAVSRRHVIFEEDGFITVSGGKYTTFRIMAQQVMQVAMNRLSAPIFSGWRKTPIIDALPIMNKVPENIGHHINLSGYLHLLGRYGEDLPALIDNSKPEYFSPIAHTPYLWAEVIWACENSTFIHLDDLLLRRLRLGLLLPEGAKAEMGKIKDLAMPVLGWDESRWQVEEERYWDRWNRYYSPAPSG